jgi:aminobenzoyl-glutamate utilization protein B
MEFNLKRILLYKSLIICLSILNFCFCQKNKQDIHESLERRTKEYENIAKSIWDFAEVGYQEEKSSKLLKETLAEEGFSISSGVAGIPTAFVAEYGSGKPIIGILAEFDALPGISQEVASERKSIIDKSAGHACGHHLFGTASTAAAIGVKDYLQSTKKKGDG